jgi:glycosyltransferase involved in cell wall biosynthesis
MKKIILYARNFYPENNGFANAATGFAEILQSIPDTKLIIVTDAVGEAPHFLHKETEIIRVGIDGSWIIHLLKKPVVNKVLQKLTLNWVVSIFEEYQSFSLSKHHLKDKDLACAFFDTGLYPFLGNKVQKLIPNKTAVRIHATADADGLMYPLYEGKNVFSILREKWFNRRSLRFIRSCKIVTATTQYYVDFYKNIILQGDTYGVWNKIHYDVIPNTMDAVIEKGFSTEDISRGKYCLMVGKMSVKGWMQKGFDEAVNAVIYLKSKKNLPKDFKLVIVGDGPMQTSLQKIVSEAGLDDYIQLIKFAERKEMMQIVAGCSFVVLPSRFEGHSIFLNEALALSKPLVISENTGASHLVDDSRNGFLITKGDYIELAEALSNMWSLNEEELDIMATHSLNLYNRNFSPVAIRNKVITIIDLISLRTNS